jgi:hypothetical protein
MMMSYAMPSRLVAALTLVGLRPVAALAQQLPKRLW